MQSIFSELKRRRVYQVAIGYGIFASAMIQVGGTILPIFHAPEWSQQVFVVLTMMGFPVALVLGWIFDITKEGIKRTPNAQGLRVYSGRQLWIVGIFGTVMAAVVLAGYWFWHPWKGAAAEASTQMGAVAFPEKSVAVLPFENLSPDKANSFFADGVQDQILTNLAAVADLRVISNTSVQQYKAQGATRRNMREIADQLRVTYILEGSVQRAANNLRVTTRLFDARSDTQIWGETYDGNVADLFAMQSKIAQAVASQLQAKLSPEQKAFMEAPPTNDVVAYELYRRAKQVIDSYLNLEDVRGTLLQALQWLDAATQRDSNFVLAYCYAARTHDLLYFYDLDPTPARVLLAEAAVKTALALRSDSAEAHLAAADYYFRCHRDYGRARQELEIARPGLPNNVALFILSGYMSRRQNRWTEGERDFLTATLLDPRNPNAYNLLSDTYVLERKFDRAEESYRRVLAAGPPTPLLKIRGSVIEYARSGNYKPIQEALASAPPNMDVGGGQTPLRVWTSLMDHNYAEAERVLNISPRTDFQDWDFTFYYPKAWYRAMVARAKGDDAAATAAFQEVRAILEKRLVDKPEHARTIAVLAEVDAGLGKTDLAVREGRHAAELMPLSKDAYDGALVLQGLAQVYTWTKQPAPAIELLRQLTSIPGYISYGYLKTHPIWEPLRGDPAFQALVASMAAK